MGLLANIKQSIGRQMLKGQMFTHKRARKVMSLNDAVTIGILFDPTDKEDYELVKKYVNYLKDMKKKVKAIGFYHAKEVPASTYSKLEFDYICLKDLNWYYYPSGVIIENFINEEYDILIDLNVNDHFPLHYISSLSKAKFKVGKNSGKGTEIYDMTIETGKDKGVKFLLRNLDTYLLMLNKKEE